MASTSTTTSTSGPPLSVEQMSLLQSASSRASVFAGSTTNAAPQNGDANALPPGRHHHRAHERHALRGPQLQQLAIEHNIRRRQTRETDEQRIVREEREEDEAEMRAAAGWVEIVLSEQGQAELWEEYGMRTGRDGSLWVRFKPQ